MNAHSLCLLQPQILGMNNNGMKSTAPRSREIRKSESSSTINSRPHDNIQYFLTNILQCKLCSLKVSNSRMCPYCCKLFCEQCLDKYLRVELQQCPYCQKALQRQAVVKCESLGKRIEQSLISSQMQQIQRVGDVVSRHEYQGIELATACKTMHIQSCSEVAQTKQHEKIQLLPVSTHHTARTCQYHNLKYEYYCITCQTGVCSDCAVLTNKHQGHRICKLASQKLALDSTVKNASERIDHFKNAIIGYRQEKLRQLQKLKCHEQSKCKSLMAYLRLLSNDSVSNRLTEEMLKKQTLLASPLFSNHKPLKTYHEFEQILKCISRSALVRKYQQYRHEIDNAIRSSTFDARDYQSAINPIQQNRIMPGYECKVFYLQKYSLCRSRNEIVFSEPFHWRGIEWRLKIYPNGLRGEETGKRNRSLSTQSETHKYLAVYLQMSKCQANTLMPFNFKIDVVNQKDRSRRISRAFQSQFDEGMCWGYDSFAKISTLYDEKYVDESRDRIQLILSVTSPTYFHAVMLDNMLISQKEETRDRNFDKIKHLSKLLSGTQLGRQLDKGSVSH